MNIEQEADGAAEGRALVERLDRAKRAFVTRRANLGRAVALSAAGAPRSGDLVLASVVELGHHTKLETPEGRRAQLHVGDDIVVAYGARYAPDQFEAVVPANVSACDLVASGGIAAHTLARHANARKPTAIAPIGRLIGANGAPLNLEQFVLPAGPPNAPVRNVIAVAGTSMNAGKTTVAVNLIRGLTRAGVRVGACKVTGTGSGGDFWAMLDAGATRVLDFTDVGFSTTAGVDVGLVESGAHRLVSELEASDVDVVVVEIADGLLQKETAALLSPPSSFAARIDAIVLAAADSMGARAAADWMNVRKLPLRAVSGLLTASPLAAREAQSGLNIEVLSSKALAEAACATRVCLQAGARQPLSVVS